MWYPVLCVILVNFLPDYVRGGIAEEMAEVTQLCCEQGTKYAQNHTLEECSSSVPPDVQPNAGSLCIFAMDQCCKEFFQKQHDCDSGIELASTGKCDSKSSSIRTCCDECAKGIAARAQFGISACAASSKETSAEDVLASNAFQQCCKRPIEDAKEETEKPVKPTQKPLLSVLPSLCEEYAPNELCAHHCIPVPGSYRCECNPGFKLMADKRNCIEVVKNRCKPRNPCQHKCNDNGIEVKCSCRRGYELKADGKSCQDIDECVLDPPVCLSGTQCFNIKGSYRCIPSKKPHPEIGQCPSGFTRNINNNACDDINECTLPNPPCPSYICENTVGGYKCGGVPGDPNNLSPPTRTADDRCPPGFRTGLNEECEDVDECATMKDDCNHMSQFCINTRGSFYCQDMVSKHCPPGFKINPRNNKCEDIDECEESEDICRSDQICVNELGQYDCKPKSALRKSQVCPDGMRIKPETGICEDIDECFEGTHLCDQYQSCLNTNGSHECLCKHGFSLDPLTGACIDVNECATNQHDCILETQRCDNTVGSYLCIRFTSCGTGYILHHSSGKCEDIDECAVGTHNCARAGPAYQCVNIPGSFRCIRKRPSTTTTTTAAPEYEEYYYDSEEDIAPETNNTVVNTTQSSQNENRGEPHIIETTPAIPSSEPSTVATQPTSKPIPAEPPVIPQPEGPPRKADSNEILTDAIIENLPPATEPQKPETEKPPVEITTIEPPPSSEPTEASKIPTLVFKQPDPEPTYIPWPAGSDKPTYYYPSPTEPIPRELPSNESIQPEPNENIEPESTYRPIQSSEPPATTLKEDKEEDRTQATPRSEWTNVVVKPRNCQPGFESDEYGACYDIDECSTNQHKCSGLTEVCRNTMGGYLCDCRPGFRRDLYTRVCDLIPTSTSTSTSTTLPPPTTIPKQYFWGYPEYRPVTVRPFRPRNLCDVGFHMNSQTGVCEDVNECVNGQANCAAVEICVNTQGGYRCECPPNWHLDEIKHRCMPNRTNGQFPTGYGNEPTYPQVENRFPEVKGNNFIEPEITPIENRGSVFKCLKGYRLGRDNVCEDIDECLTGEANCGPLQICNNLPGGYSCNCPSGHRLTGDHQCEDVDECSAISADGNVPICSKNADCVNTIGSYRCQCHEGFRSAPVNDKVCVDVDECTENRAGSLCEHRCNNVWGSYRCSCHRGYRLNSDNITCKDIDECTEFKSKVPCVGRCVNMPGSYRCACPSGYRLSEDKRSCIDIDECENGEAPCAGTSWTGSGSSNVCLNTRGSYRCHKITCPPGYQLESKNRCTKVERVCSIADWECAHQPSTYSYNFITFVSNLYIPESKVDLFTMRGPTWAQSKTRFQLRLVDVNAPPSVNTKAEIHSFLLTQSGNQAVVSLVRPLEGPQSIELELNMELYSHDQFGGIAVAKIFIFVSEYEF